MTLLKTVSVAFSFEILILFMNMILSTMSLYNLFLRLLSSRPAEEKMCSVGTDVARMSMAMIERVFPLILFSNSLKGQS